MTGLSAPMSTVDESTIGTGTARSTSTTRTRRGRSRPLVTSPRRGRTSLGSRGFAAPTAASWPCSVTSARRCGEHGPGARVVKIGAFTTDWNFSGPTPTYGGTSHMRLRVPGLELAKHDWTWTFGWELGIETEGNYFCLKDQNGYIHDDCDIIVIQRWMEPQAAEWITKARSSGQVVINDIDDWFWGIPQSNVAFAGTHKKNNPHFNREHYKNALSASSCVTVSTPYLAERLSGIGVKNVEVLRNAIDLDRWPVLDPTDKCNVGWIGGIPWRGSDLQLLKGIMGDFLERNDLEFFHGGHVDSGPAAWQQMGFDPKRFNYAPIVGIDEYPALWHDIDIALAPLEDIPFNRAKSWLKGMEASACGLPFIASDLPEYRALGVGRRAKNPQQWKRHLTELLDPDVRAHEGKLNRERAEELCIANQWTNWDDLYRRLLDG